MLTVSIRRKILLLLLASVLVAPWASAAALKPESSRAKFRAVEPAAEFLNRLWGFLRRVGSKEGCDIDPDGRCAPRPSPTRAGVGCDIDPDGSCAFLKQK